MKTQADLIGHEIEHHEGMARIALTNAMHAWEETGDKSNYRGNIATAERHFVRARDLRLLLAWWKQNG